MIGRLTGPPVSRIARLSPMLVALALAGCGGGGRTTTEGAATSPATTAGTTAPRQLALRTYFLRDAKVWPVARRVDATEAVAAASLRALAAGPRPGDGARLETAVPVDYAPSIDLADGV